MDKDRIKGKAEDTAGRAERQMGEWTGDKKMQEEGLKHQVKGKARNVVGEVKDAARDAMEDVRRDNPPEDVEDIDREKGAA
ncbi:MAG TPA: CsbD family protein [Candidatus Angelobacter sp.]